jgi:hypothetical protein
MRGNEVPAYSAIADRLVAQGKAEIGTMMGHPCLRTGGAFFATAGHSGQELIVKLPVDRVRELIAAGVGEPFAPAGRTFREWVAVPHDHRRRWADLVEEARLFVTSGQGE